VGRREGGGLTRGRRAGDELRGVSARLLSSWAPIIVSNRAPYEPAAGGTFVRGAGGMVSGLTSVAEATGARWVACARTPRERELAKGGPLLVNRRRAEELTMDLVDVGSEPYRLHYSVIANPLLWFVQHALWNLPEEPLVDQRTWHAWREGYTKVNRLLAERVAQLCGESRRPPLVLTQDYQLYLAPRRVRELAPSATLQQFIHIPWPSGRYWKVLPAEMRGAIIDGLLANDIVGLQTRADVDNFLAVCGELMKLRVDYQDGAVIHRKHVTWVRPYPISVNCTAIERSAATADVDQEVAAIEEWRPRHLIVRVDRVDPSKNILRGFLAYERMLLDRPSLRGKVVFWAFLQPTRKDVPVYREYLRRVTETAELINRRLGKRGWTPIRLELKDSMRRALAAYRCFDVLLVNPIYDGMNLVAKEGVLLNRRDGVLVLSENAGAHEELGRHAVSINPFDVDATAAALFEALSMPHEERRRLGAGAAAVVRRYDQRAWFQHQFEDLRTLAPRRSTSRRG
jgi:trehalose 6-phosphate synthase